MVEKNIVKESYQDPIKIPIMKYVNTVEAHKCYMIKRYRDYDSRG